MVDDNNETTIDATIPSSVPIGNDAVVPIPLEPHPEPIVSVASTTDVVKEPTVNVDQILGNSSTIIPTNSPTQEVPSHKKKNMAGIIVGLMLFLGVVATGAYFVAKPDSLADLRSQAGCDTCKTAKDFQEFYQDKNKEAREKKAAEEPKEEKQPLNDYEKCRLDSGTAKCNELFPQYAEIPGMPKKEEVAPNPGGSCPAGSFTCGSGKDFFCSTDPNKTCNQLIAERNPDATVNIGSVKCVKNNDGAWMAEPGKYSLDNSTSGVGVVVVDGVRQSVNTQVTLQCQKQMNAGGFATSGTTKKYICKEGVKGEGNIVYSGGACTEKNGKVFTGNLGCFCGTIQVDTNAGHESYTSTCGCDKDKPAPEPTSASVLEPTPTTPNTSPICTNIKVYKGAEQITPSTLLPEDAVTIAVVGTGNPTQARFRVNGVQITGDTDADPNWTISTTKNTSGEYFVSYTIPTGVTSFLFEGETFAQGEWH